MMHRPQGRSARSIVVFPVVNCCRFEKNSGALRYFLLGFFLGLCSLILHTTGFVSSALSFYDANHTPRPVSDPRITLSCLTKCHCLVTGRAAVLLAVADKRCHQWAILRGSSAG